MISKKTIHVQLLYQRKYQHKAFPVLCRTFSNCLFNGSAEFKKISDNNDNDNDNENERCSIKVGKRKEAFFTKTINENKRNFRKEL